MGSIGTIPSWPTPKLALPISTTGSSTPSLNKGSTELALSLRVNGRRARIPRHASSVYACLPLPSPASSPSPSYPKTKLFVSGLSFSTTEETLRNAFKDFGNILQLDHVMDKIANRPRGFAFIRYATEEESQNAIKGMHGKGDLCGDCKTKIRASPRPQTKPRTILKCQ